MPARVLRVALGLVLTPFFFMLAALRNGPGLLFHLFCMRIGFRLLIWGGGEVPRKQAGALVLAPMDSTRYFEFDFFAKNVPHDGPRRYLDVSSPRMVPIYIARNFPEANIDLINPDAGDLADTRRFLRGLDLDARVPTHDCLISDAPFPDSTFDLITCISVLEHIPDDTKAVEKMWSLLRPGGSLILTLPCLAQEAEQYIDLDTYKLLEVDADGFVFWQRFYDQRALEARVLSVLGSPVETKVFGECVAGSFHENAQWKRRARWYPFWREPYMMATEYKLFGSIGELPGDGVVAMRFVKP